MKPARGTNPDKDSPAGLRDVLARTQAYVSKDGPMVSVIVPTFNRLDLLPEALNSILQQTWQDFEIIVVNDGGTSVAGVVAGLDAQARITCLTLPVHRGVAAARNAGLQAARGTYVAFLDDDDIFLSNHLETLVQFLETRPETVAYTDAYCAVQEPLAAGGCGVVSRTVPYSADWDAERILYENFVPTLCFMFKRIYLATVGDFDETLTTHEDWDLWIRLSQRYTMQHIKQTTCEFRRRKDGQSMTYAQLPDFARTRKIIYESYYPLAQDKPHVLKRQRENLVADLRASGPNHRSWPNHVIQELLGKKLRGYVRKCLTAASRWF